MGQEMQVFRCMLSRSPFVRMVAGTSIIALGYSVTANTSAVAQSSAVHALSALAEPLMMQEKRTKPSSSERTITLITKDTPLRDVLKAFAQQSNRPILYNDKYPEFAKRVSVRIIEQNLNQSLNIVLQGTRLVAEVAPDNETIVIRPVNDSSLKKSVQKGIGIVQGIVVEAGTKTPVNGAVVEIPGGSRSFLTGSDGKFILRNVPLGEQRVIVKLFGYRLVSHMIVVKDQSPITIQIELVAVPTTLSGVVTTATGEQRRIEVGNDITVINADSVVRNAPISSLSELLATRVPGLYAAPASGEPGAATRIRIRGVSSVNASNDPILIVDGIQVYARQIEPAQVDNNNDSKSLRHKKEQTFALSPLDQIDPNSIETVEVLKGPSAVALYGSDAANGVIVVTTKRGQAGPVRWSVSGDWGTQYMPGKWPTNYWAWGHSPSDETMISQCTQDFRGVGCIFDSLVTYQILNDPATTVFGRGTNQKYSGTVSGGTSAITYSLTGNVGSVLGLVKLPDADVNILKSVGFPVLERVRRPQSNEQQDGTAKVNINVGQTVLTFTTALIRQLTEGSPLSNATYQSATFAPGLETYGSDGELLPRGSGLMEAIPDFQKLNSSRALRSMNSIQVRNNFPYKVSTQITAGFDITSRFDRSLLKNGECYVVKASCSGTGVYFTGQGYAGQTNVNMSAMLPLSMGHLLTLRTTVGANYLRTTTNDLLRTAEGIPVGATSGNGAELYDSYEVSDDRATAGVYAETQIGIANRFYFPLAVRRDAGSALGSRVAPKFPRISMSYVLSDEPRFSNIPFANTFSTLRLRAAYGQAGNQPEVGATVRTYFTESAVLDGTAQNIVRIAGFGNSQLKPERSSEVELGFDASLFDDRISISPTWYRTRINDLLFSELLPVSVGGGGTRLTNLGDLQKGGWDLSIDLTVLQQRALTLRSGFTISQMSNELIRVDPKNNESGAFTPGVFTRHVVGYPLYGIWSLPIIGYADRNQDGRITKNEVLRGDSAIFLGGPDPKFIAGIHQSATVIGNIMLNVGMSYQHGQTQTRDAGSPKDYSRARNDPSASLAEQAYQLHSELMKAQSVSTFRFTSLSIGANIPRTFTRSIIPNRTVRMSLRGTNLGIWTTYRGKDPNVNSVVGEGSVDRGALPTPRVWGLNVGIN